MSTNVVSHVSYMIKACSISLRHYPYRIWWRFFWSYLSSLGTNKLSYIYTRGYYLHQNWLPASGTARSFLSATTPLGSAFQEAEAAAGCSEWLRQILLGQRFLHHSSQCDGSSSNLSLWGGLLADVEQAIWLFAQHFFLNRDFPFCGGKDRWGRFLWVYVSSWCNTWIALTQAAREALEIQK